MIRQQEISARGWFATGGIIGQFLRFAVVGGTATLVHVAAALIVSAKLGLSPNLSNLIGFLTAVTVSFVGHSLFTFRVKVVSSRHVLRFVIISLISLLSSSLTTYFCTRNGGSIFTAMGFVAIVTPLASFFAAKLWAFSETPHDVNAKSTQP